MTSRTRVEPKSVGRYTPIASSALNPDAGVTEGLSETLAAVAPLWDVLEDAATRVRASWEQEGLDGHTADEVAAPLAAVCGALRQAVRGQVPEIRGLPPTLASRRLLDLLRRAFLAGADRLATAPDARALLLLLQGFEQVQQAVDRDAAQRFASRLTGADGLQLIVEVAHDMRSPLGSILFLAERLRNGQSGPVTQIQERQLGLVYGAAFGLSALASDVIELARGGDRLIDHAPIPFSITELLHSVRDIVQPVAEEKGLTLDFIPAEIDTRLGHPAALNRVLLNLTTNALKFTAVGSVEVRCRQLSRTALEFSVSDTGRGIPEPVLATLFDAFRRRQRPGDYTFSSAGLGLSICQKLVRAMQGELRVETEIEKGTCFSFVLELPPAATM